VTPRFFTVSNEGKTILNKAKIHPVSKRINPLESASALYSIRKSDTGRSGCSPRHGDLCALVDLGGKTEVAAGESAQVFQAVASPDESVEDEAVRILYRVVTGGLWGRKGGIGTPYDRSNAVDTFWSGSMLTLLLGPPKVPKSTSL
jgi:hypothetical protein